GDMMQRKYQITKQKLSLQKEISGAELFMHVELQMIQADMRDSVHLIQSQDTSLNITTLKIFKGFYHPIQIYVLYSLSLFKVKVELLSLIKDILKKLLLYVRNTMSSQSLMKFK